MVKSIIFFDYYNNFYIKDGTRDGRVW
jgi:hypothetical protein